MAQKIFTSLESEVSSFKKKQTPLSLMLEDFDNRGIMDDRDVDYLEHLDVPTPEVDDVAMEGIIRAVAHDAGSAYTDVYRELKGWFLGIESKRKYIEEICIDLIDWLKDKDADERNLNLDMGSFKTWMKTSESFFWRFYFLLNDEVWRNIENDLKKGEISQLERIYDLEFKDRVKVTRYLDSIDNIPDLIKVVETYIKRGNRFFELIMQRKVKVKMAPFQVILLGAADLRRTVKKIVNLAI
jgi:hypothetical protein